MFNKRGTEDIYYDILRTIDDLQFIQASESRIMAGRHRHSESRGRKASGQFQSIKGALLRNVTDRCNLSSRQSKIYLMEMYSQGLIDLGIYIKNVNRDYLETEDMTGKRHTGQDRLITVTEKGYKLLRMLNDMSEMVKSGGPERKRN